MANAVSGLENIEDKPKKQFLNYINVFRGLAILLIIMGHTMQFGNQGSLLRLIVCEIVCGGTALFIFISGFLFQHLSKKFEYKNYLSKKWTNVILPYLFTAIPGIFLCLYCPVLYKNTFFGLNEFLQIPLLLSIGRVHNVPTWFIPMIVLFFICSWLLLKLEKKNLLYKALPVLFLVTIFLQRGSIEYEELVGMSYFAKYIAYLKYIFIGFVHFFSLYVFGMYCSSNKDIIDKFYNNRFIIWVLMIATSILDIYLTKSGIYSNYTVSKIFLTMLLIGYLKHYDSFIISHNKTNKALDFIAKYSFGLFFVHWYFLFAYNQIFRIMNVVPVVSTNWFIALVSVTVRFLSVTAVSLLALYILKKLILKISSKLNTRMFLGV